MLNLAINKDVHLLDNRSIISTYDALYNALYVNFFCLILTLSPFEVLISYAFNHCCWLLFKE